MQSGWNVKAVWELADVKGGKRLPKGRNLQKFATPYPYIRVADMTHGTVNLSDIHYVPSDVAPSIRKYRIFSDDIFISVAGTLGIVGKIPEDLNGAYLTENADRLTDIKCDRDYLMYVLQSNSIQREINSIRTVGAQPKLALGRIKDFEIILPEDRQEQSRIARALNTADTFLKELEKIITKKRAIKQGLMQELLTGRTRLPGFFDEWVSIPVAKLSHIKARIGWQGLTTSEYLKSGVYRLVGGTDFLEDGSLDWAEVPFVSGWRYSQDLNIQLRPNDVLITKDGTIGKVAIVNELSHPATLNSGVYVVRPKGNAYDPRFMFWMLKSSAFDTFINSLSAGSTINHLYQKDLVSLSFMVPKDLEEQKAIASVIDAAQKEISALEKQLESAKAIKQGMMQELLSGRTRLLKEG